MYVCFVSEKAVQTIVGNVKEALIQEVGVVIPDDLCVQPQSTGDASYAFIFGSKGIMPLNSTGQGLFAGIPVFKYDWSRRLLVQYCKTQLLRDLTFTVFTDQEASRLKLSGYITIIDEDFNSI